jgi:hypothetical protein
MVSTDLVRKIRYLKANPKLAELIPQSDMLILMGDLLRGFPALQKGIETNKITGPKGADGYTPRPDVDYASLRSFDQALSAFEAKYNQISNRLDSKLSTIQNGKDGKDAEITPELVAEIADMAAQMIELPNFANLIQMEPEAIRNSLELLKDDDRLSIEAIRGLQDQLEVLAQRAVANGGTIGKQQVFGFFKQFIPVSATAPNNPQINDLWVDLS